METKASNCGNRGNWVSTPTRDETNIAQKAFHWGESCVLCFNCRQKTFRDFDLCREWVEYKGQQVRKGWTKTFAKNKNKITIYWCNANRNGRMKATSPGIGIKNKDKEKYCDFFNGE